MDLTPFWRAVETIHDVVYFAPDAKARFQALGLKGFWMGYFASRAGCLGTPSAQVVTATFHGFSPTMVARAVPDCWTLADPEAVLAERVAIARDALAPALDTALAVHDPTALAERLAPVLDGLDLAGKPLAAGEASLPVPDDGLGALWRRASVLREYRGDCHVAVLVGEGLGGAAANVLQTATGHVLPGQREARGWTEDEWAAAVTRLTSLGWLDDTGAATMSGRSTRDRLEDATDRSCAAFMSPAARAAAEAVTDNLVAAARAVSAADVVPFPNPTGGAAP